MQHKLLRNLIFTATFFLAIFISTVVQANTIYVNINNTSGTYNGTSWATAFNDFQSGINAANAGDTVWVAAGTYQPASGVSFSMKSSVKIYGGFAGTETNFTQRNWQTNIDSLEGNGASVISNNGVNDSASLDGFTVTGGNSGGDGGGILNTSSSPTITNCIFSNNSSQYNGGGIANESSSSSSSPTITNCTFSNNYADVSDFYGDGGGIYSSSSSATITNCTFNNNSAISAGGGGIANESSSSPTITNCIFTNNSCADGIGGGGMYISSSSATITGCTFSNNSTGGANGGGIYNSSSSATITNCAFSNNNADGAAGGGINNFSSSAIITNCVFTNNSASAGGNGGGIANNFSSPSITNCTFSNDSSATGGFGGGISNFNSCFPTITNSVFWGNTDGGTGTPDIYNDGSGTDTTNYCFTQETTVGTGNILGSIDPFVNDGNPVGVDGIFGTADDGLELTGCSPAINTGNNTADTTSTDITSQPRIFNITIDMGAYEYEALPDGTSLAIAGDITIQPIYSGNEALIASGSCRIIAKILPGGSSPVADTVISKLYIDASVQSYLGQPYVQRHYDITPLTNASTATATVTLFATQAEFDAFNAVSSVKLPTGPSDNTGIANLNVIQFHGTSATGTPGSYSGSEVTIVPTTGNVVWNGAFDRWEITFAVNGFSGFIITTGGTVLSLNVLSFTGQLVNGKSQLQWQTANEINTSYFEVDKSTDGTHFDSLTTVKAIGTGNNSYTIVDAYPQIGNNYYRLRSVNNDGSFTYSNIVQIQVGSNGNAPFVIYPNPTCKQLTVEYNNVSNEAIINIFNLAGQKVVTVPTNGQTKTTIDVSNLVAGAYFIEYNSTTETVKNKFVKIN